MIQLQANIGGFMGAPKSVFAALDEDTEILVVAAMAPLRARRNGCFLIRSERRGAGDSVFDPAEHLKESIQAYYALKQDVAADGVTAKLRIGERAMQCDPSGVIETDGYDANGPKYRVSPDARNEQIAVLALCRYVQLRPGITDAIEMADIMTRLMRGEAVTF